MDPEASSRIARNCSWLIWPCAALSASAKRSRTDSSLASSASCTGRCCARPSKASAMMAPSLPDTSPRTKSPRERPAAWSNDSRSRRRADSTLPAAALRSLASWAPEYANSRAISSSRNTPLPSTSSRSKLSSAIALGSRPAWRVGSVRSWTKCDACCRDGLNGRGSASAGGPVPPTTAFRTNSGRKMRPVPSGSNFSINASSISRRPSASSTPISLWRKASSSALDMVPEGSVGTSSDICRRTVAGTAPAPDPDEVVDPNRCGPGPGFPSPSPAATAPPRSAIVAASASPPCQ
mmetsp:Transcript_4884/g.14709  ORF Transcript_4884/g.14709 Transcript_4884/m.14709 type:complete len:294 (+) Transcript_4884:1378-2259(+)